MVMPRRRGGGGGGRRRRRCFHASWRGAWEVAVWDSVKKKTEELGFFKFLLPVG